MAKAAKMIDEAQLLLAFMEIQDEIINEEKEGAEKGFDTEGKRALYTSMKLLFPEGAEDATKALLHSIKGELDIIGWAAKGRVLKDIENKIMRSLKMANIDRKVAKQKAKEMVETLKNNQ